MIGAGFREYFAALLSARSSGIIRPMLPIRLEEDELTRLKHELRTSLAVALAASAILKNDGLSRDSRAAARALERNLRRLRAGLEEALTRLTSADNRALDARSAAGGAELIREEP